VFERDDGQNREHEQVLLIWLPFALFRYWKMTIIAPSAVHLARLFVVMDARDHSTLGA
jgi:hypothetical protein